MVQVQDFLQIFNYLNRKYGLTRGIYIHVVNVPITLLENWEVEGSNTTFVFRSIETFHFAVRGGMVRESEEF